MASEFKQDNNFTFSASPYSVVDRLLEIAMNDLSAAGNFKILLDATVNRLKFNGQAVERVVLKGGVELRTQHVVLCRKCPQRSHTAKERREHRIRRWKVDRP